MLYDAKNDKLTVGCREFVNIARRGMSESVLRDEDEPHSKAADDRLTKRYIGTEPCSVYTVFEVEGIPVELSCPVGKIEGDVLSFLCLTEGDPRYAEREFLKQKRAEAYIAAYVYALSEGHDSLLLRLYYANPDFDTEYAKEERVGIKKLTRFFEKCKTAVALFAPPEIDRVRSRLPSMARARFPYPQKREGQDAFIRAAYRTIKRGTRLLAEAPTGIGKTVSALYPAIRAMGEGVCRKTFYFTPKTTTARAACECVQLLAKHGVRLRAVSLTAKASICQNGSLCKEDRSACRNLSTNRIPEAALALFRKEIPAVTRKEVQEVAREYGVCPYELSLSYAELCDVIIGDVNYLFDPRVYLRRFFDEGGEYALLIDEAHNLPERAREMFSAEMHEDTLSFSVFPLGEFSELKKVISEEKEHFCKLLFAYIKNELREKANGETVGFAHGKQLPSELFGIFEKLTEAARKEIYRTESKAEAAALKSYYYTAKRFYDTLCRFDDGYEYFIFYEEGKLRLKLYCIDTGAPISRQCEKGRAAVFFSATMNPIEYYRTLLGFDGGCEVLTVDSPFDPERMCISIMDKISLRSSERARTLPEVVRVITATISAKRGNYMIFCPSYAYCEELSRVFRARYPKLRTLVQAPDMSPAERAAFLEEFSKESPSYLIGFCVTGGIYSEGIDLWGDRLIGAVVIGVGLPSLSVEREAISAYFDEKCEAGRQYAYIYPGMNKVLQAGGRVIRREQDRGVIVLIDDRFADPVYKKSIPKLWHGLKFVGDAKGLRILLDRFWQSAADL